MPEQKKADIPDILLCEENRKGCVHICTDPSGNARRVRELVESLKRDDTVHILGDLCDRDKPNRPGSFALIRFLNEIRKQREEDSKAEVPNVVVIRGNHENAFLAAYPVLRKNKDDAALFNKLSQKNQELAKAAYDKFMEGGGEWAVAAERTLKDLEEVHDYFVDLPYTTDTPGKRGFYTVHSDMMLDEETLQQKIAQKQFMFDEVQIGEERFSADELRDYATNARDSGRGSQLTPALHGRTKDSKIVFVGHNALVYKDKQDNLVQDKRRRAVRTETNTVNLDGNAPECDALVVVNQTLGLCYQFGTEQEVLKPIVSSIQYHLLIKAPELVDIWIENLANDKIDFRQLKAGYQLATPKKRTEILAKLKALTADNKAQRIVQQLENLKDEDFLLELAQQGEFDTLVEFLKRNKKIQIDHRDDKQKTALHYAAAACHVKAVQELCDRGADPFIDAHVRLDAPVQIDEKVDEKGLAAKAPTPAPTPPLPFVLAVANKTTPNAKPAALKALADKCIKNHAAVVLQFAQTNQWKAMMRAKI